MKPVFFCLLFLASVSRAQLMFQLNEDKLLRYVYSDGDEFNQPALDEQRWTNGLGWTRVLFTQDLAFNPNNVVLKDGILQLILNKQDSIYTMYDWEIDTALLKRRKWTLVDNKWHTHYSAGCIISKQKYHYGFYEIKFKVEEGRGIWPAYWFFGGNKNEEIDIFELKCERNNSVHVEAHCPQGCGREHKNKLGFKTNWGGWLPLSNYLHEGYNTMQLQWAQGELLWFVNGYPLAYFKGDFPNPMNLYLNTSIAKDGEVFKPGPNKKTGFPNTYSVDYFRAWKLLDETGETVLQANKNFVLSEPFELGKAALPKKRRGVMYNKKQLNAQQGFITLSFSDNQLSLVVSGELREEKKVNIVLKSHNTNSIWQVNNNLTQVWKSDINPNTDYELELIIDVNKKRYTQKIKLEK